MLQPVMSVKEAAGYLKVQPRTVRDWIAAGTIAARKIGKSYIIPEQEIGKMIAGVKKKKETTLSNDARKARSTEFRSLLRGGKPVDKAGIRSEWDQDLTYEKRVCEPR